MTSGGIDDELDARLKALARQLPAVVWTVDREMRFTASVGGGLPALGLSENEVVGSTLFDYFRSDDPDFEPIAAHVRALRGESVKYAIDFAGRHFETYTEPFRDDAGEIVGALGIALDVTDRVVAEAEREQLHGHLRAHQKLEAVGQLAGGVAHEVNNPVQAIMNFAQLIKSRANQADVREYADEIHHEAQRVAGIVRNLQAFARQGDEMAVEVRVWELVERTMALFHSVLRKEQIDVQIEVPHELPIVLCRPQGVQQVLVNLLTNAREALNDRFSGEHADKRIHITAHERDGGVRLSVADWGTPISLHDEPRVFEPFTTLRGRDQGSGLALAIAHAIAEENDGSLTFEATPERTVFHLDLPRTAA